ncbi:MAG TPA: lytic transglycosylase domain-containing protein [Candidatus Pacearchaeota archaeon]|nr:lytic transglycosylase domain-containing protein [Candidatus Pacearchaeota archaeon]
MTIKNYIKKKLKKGALIAALTIAGASFYSGEKVDADFPKNSSLYNSPNLEYAKMISNNYITNVDKSTPFEKAKAEYEKYKNSELEKMLNEDKKRNEELEKIKFLKPHLLSPDLLNEYIKQAYSNVKKFPKEFDKRLFRVMLRQESHFDAHAVSKSGYIGLGQLGPEAYETVRPEEFAKFVNPYTGKFDTLALQKDLFNPVKNLEISLETLNFISKFCAKYDPNWKESDLETKRKKILFAYNAGVGTAKEYDFNPNTKINSKNKKLKKLPKENREYPEIIMDAYNNPNIRVKL